VDLIAAEDTRHSQPLLNHFGITTKQVAYHAHNEAEQTDYVLQQLKEGHDIALISDAGTPLISDPGYSLVHKAIAADIDVIPVPGASAVLCALAASGLATDSFYFAGFLPAKSGARKSLLTSLQEMTSTLIFYEAPHRIIESLSDVQAIFGSRTVVLARELTKKFETFYRGPAQNILQQLTEEQQRGEMVLLIAGKDKPRTEEELSETVLQTLKVLLAELPLAQAVKLAAQITGVKKNKLYDWAVAHKS
jgi:16S rRNA (cytidine1402-2'-O)-methyltransferase